MKYFFSSPHQYYKVLNDMQIENLLLSYAVDAKTWKIFHRDNANILIDSGAFSLWKSGKTLDVEAYKDFCLSLPQNFTFISLDVIPQTGSSQKDIDICCEKGWENYLYLKKYIKNLMPVYHYGDKLLWLKKYATENPCLLGVSPANDTGEPTKREFLRETYRTIGTSVKTHLLGYSSFEGLRLFPAYSCDSISYKKSKVIYNGQKAQFYCNTHMYFLLRDTIRKFLAMEKLVTQLWERRGVVWEETPQVTQHIEKETVTQ